MTHLVIAGHGMQRNGRFDPGATGLITKGEHKYVVEDLFPAMKRHLPKNHNVVFYSENKVSNYGNLESLVKKYNADQVTEIHFDAAASSSARGGHVIVHSRFKPDKTDLALRDAIKNMVGVRYSHRGYEGISGRSNLYNVNLAANKGITYRLTELGFGTNKTDAGILTGKVDEYAKELVKAITGSVASKPKPKPSASKTATSHTKVTKKSKTISQMAKEVIDGKHGNGHTNRRRSLGISQSEYNKVRAEVNAIASGKKHKPTLSKTFNQMASEVKKGLHGNGHENRRKSLGISKTDYEKVRKLVNAGTPPSSGKTISQMAKEVIDGKHGNGHANRRRSLGISQAQYNKVRAEVNRRA